MGKLTGNCYGKAFVEVGTVNAVDIQDPTSKEYFTIYQGEAIDKLAAYEDIIDDPEKLKIIDALYLERCEEINRLKAELAEKEEFCEWKLWDEESNVYETTCGNLTILSNGTPKENKYGFCPYCGRKIKEVQNVN